ncbi:hypothetical protein NE237_006119 [Protea cynaroides]|uniref:Uncharacterized protein n=1 Tax=Protea cynaroides TaxID=273540 RepID=A0A9Q0QV46_9MAGN|nr:hypothetical protein NE237_006119 [Protea cynaroides]
MPLNLSLHRDESWASWARAQSFKASFISTSISTLDEERGLSFSETTPTYSKRDLHCCDPSLFSLSSRFVCLDKLVLVKESGNPPSEGKAVLSYRHAEKEED